MKLITLNYEINFFVIARDPSVGGDRGNLGISALNNGIASLRSQWQRYFVIQSN